MTCETQNEVLELTDLLPLVHRWLAPIGHQSPAEHLFPFSNITIQVMYAHDYRNVNGILLHQLPPSLILLTPSHCQTIVFIYIFYLIYVFSDRLSASRSSNLRLINSSIAFDMNCISSLHFEYQILTRRNQLKATIAIQVELLISHEQ